MINPVKAIEKKFPKLSRAVLIILMTNGFKVQLDVELADRFREEARQHNRNFHKNRRGYWID